jgi:DNA-binding transcriptional MerR regulator
MQILFKRGVMRTSAAAKTMHKIGAVSKLSGIPTPTLRSWESRYATFTPQKSGTRHRLYTDDDLLKATLLKRLIDQGLGIGSIAALDTRALNNLLQQRSQMQSGKRVPANGSGVLMAVVGLALAGRIESPAFAQVFKTHALRVTEIFEDVAEALASPKQKRPQILLLRINSLHAPACVEIQKLIEQCGALRAIVLYGFGQEHVIQSMRQGGMIVRKEPVPDPELADLISAVLLVDPGRNATHSESGTLIPPRKFSDITLAKVAASTSNVLCECPRHVAEIIAQLASFEQYSHDCLNKSSEDARIHAYLSSVSGSARALFEGALQTIARHEGFELKEIETREDP